MIVLFTDFGLEGPYTGQMKAVLHQMAPVIPTIDLFAGATPGERRTREDSRLNSSDDHAEIVYVDHFGKALTGLGASMMPPEATLAVAGRALESTTTFSDRPPGTAFWYENSNGLAEIAVN